MNDSDFIQEIARKWVELGGDSEGVKYGWKRLQEAVIEIEYAQQSVHPTGGNVPPKWDDLPVDVDFTPKDISRPATSG